MCGNAVPIADWDAVTLATQKAAGVFANSFHAGIDVLLMPNFRRHAVLEVNTFGDHLAASPGSGWTVEAEMRLMMERQRREVA